MFIVSLLTGASFHRKATNVNVCISCDVVLFSDFRFIFFSIYIVYCLP